MAAIKASSVQPRTPAPDRQRRFTFFRSGLLRTMPRMTGADEVLYYPVLQGLTVGDRVVTSGSFLLDAETRLNPAAGSIYFGGSSGSGKAQAATVNSVRPSTPADDDLWS